MFLTVQLILLLYQAAQGFLTTTPPESSIGEVRTEAECVIGDQQNNANKDGMDEVSLLRLESRTLGNHEFLPWMWSPYWWPYNVAAPKAAQAEEQTEEEIMHDIEIEENDMGIAGWKPWDLETYGKMILAEAARYSGKKHDPLLDDEPWDKWNSDIVEESGYKMLPRVYSFGAGGSVHDGPWESRIRPGTSKCIPGARVVQESKAYVTRDGDKQLRWDIFAGWFSGYHHSLLDVLKLHERPGDWDVIDCDSDPHNGRDSTLWPLDDRPKDIKYRELTKYMEPLMAHGAYHVSMNMTLVKMKRKLIRLPYLLFFCEAAYAYDPRGIQAAAHYVRWRWVGYSMSINFFGLCLTANGLPRNNDFCNKLQTKKSYAMSLVQHPTSLNCVLVFRGTKSEASLEDNLLYSTEEHRSFCGHDVSPVVEAHLPQLVEAPAYHFSVKPKMRKCSSIWATGHSLGGTCAESFIGCAHQKLAPGEKGYSDYSKIHWGDVETSRLNEDIQIDDRIH